MSDSRYIILAVEESANSLCFYDSKTYERISKVQLSLWPHEVAISPDGKTDLSRV